MIKNEIQYNVGNIDRKSSLMESFPPSDWNLRKPDPMASLEVESRILQSITELGRNIKSMEFSIKDMDSEKKTKLFNSIKEKLEVLEDVLKEINPKEEDKEEDKEEE